MLIETGAKVAFLALKAFFCCCRVFKILIVFAVLNACSQNYYEAPVADREPPPSRKVTTHIVASGETLYSIAWRYDLDTTALAKANNIGQDFRIYPGQVLDLNVDSRKPWAERRKLSHQKSPQQEKSQKTNARSKNQSTADKKDTKEVKTRQNLKWQWPLEGKILTRFRVNSVLQKGIDIRGKLGEAVRAAGAGVVVYSGDGLRGYGKLLIVKHSDTYLSAYAHNRRLLVKEGDTVQAGEKIAEVGSTGTDTVKLYFEIRRDGKPVDPLHYLPKT